MPQVEIQVVTPGSADDPFAPKSTAPSDPAGSKPADTVAPASGEEAKPGTVVAAPVDPKAAPAPTVTGLDEATVQRMIEEKLRDQQSGYDRRINVLSSQLEAERVAAKETAAAQEKSLREAKLTDEKLTPEDRQKLKEQWDVADQKALLSAWQEQLEGYHAQLTVASLIEEFGAYGVTADKLEACQSPEEMEAFCLETKANALEAQIAAGKTTTVAPAPAPVSTSPAGVTRTSDAGGGGGAPHQEQAMNAEPGRENLASNISKAGWDTVKLPY